MREKSSPRANSRKQSWNQSGSPAVDFILFPKAFENEWELLDARETDIARARFFLIQFTYTTNLDPKTSIEVVSIAGNQQHRTVSALAFAVQTRIFANHHATFAATPLLQCMRFLLIKTRVLEVKFSDETMSVIDFFFDPTMRRNIEPLAKNLVAYKYPAARMKVCIVGGGPTALSSALSLAEKGKGRVEIHIYEKRWIKKHGPNGPYIDYSSSAVRRDQVVTLQDSVTTLMSQATQRALFENRPECVWPSSANLQIRKVEDRLLRRCQAAEFRGLIYFHPKCLTRDDLPKVGDFHVLLGADGASSWVRKSYFQGYEKERGKSYALGLAFDRPAGLPWSQPLNMFLTLSQTRYLLNASDFDGKGYLNMQLTEEEWHQMVALDGEPVTFGRPGCIRVNGKLPKGFKESQIFAPSENRGTRLWKSIEDGLKLFGFKESDVINIVRIPIIVQAVETGVQVLPLMDSQAINRPHALVAVAGDAAMTVHFWPGRGLNSGIKSGIALADELVHALHRGRFVGLPLDAMREYNNFILQLQGREHDKRCIPILNQSGSPERLGWLLSKAHAVPENAAIEWLIGAMTQIAERLELRTDWAFAPVANVELQLRFILRQLDPVTIREMAVSFPWPTREMAGAEVLPIRSIQTKVKKKWIHHFFKSIRDEKLCAHAKSRSQPASTFCFEAPRAFGFHSPVLIESNLGQNNAIVSSPPFFFEKNRIVTNNEKTPGRPRSLSQSNDVPLERLLSINKCPSRELLRGAIAFGLCRVDEELSSRNVDEEMLPIGIRI